MKIYCVIPAYNEEKNIGKIVEELIPYEYNIIIVDDGSIDNTFLIALKYSGTSDKIAILRHIINRGQGAALQTGTEYALKMGADVIVHFDADGQFLAKEISEVARPIIEGRAQAVFGSRFLEKKSAMPFFKKMIIMPLARLSNKFFLGVTMSDPQNGFRALSKEAANKIKIENRGMAHCSEILRKIKENRLVIEEVPVTVIYHNFGQKLNGGIKILKDLFLGRLLN